MRRQSADGARPMPDQEPLHQAEACDYADGSCAHGLFPATDCVSRIARQGAVVMTNCRVCSPSGVLSSWHLDGACLRCKERARGRDA